MAEQAPQRVVVVVGGGITGLVTALRLRQAPTPPTVVLLESDDRVGGKLRASPFAGLPAVDEGADAFLARVPWGIELATEVGLGDDLVSPSAGPAFIWWNGAMHAMPEGLVLGVPTGIARLARTNLLSWPGKARAALEPLLPRSSLGDDNLGSLIRRRFGSEVLVRLVDPLIGSINAGDSDHLSLDASALQLAEVANRERSLLVGLRRNRRAVASGPIFLAPRTGMAALAAAVNALLAADDGVEVHTGRAVEEVTPAATRRWRVSTSGSDVSFEADAVVLATPAWATAPILRSVARAAADAAAAIPYASVTMVTLACRDDQISRPIVGSGYLVPKPAQRHITAGSWASRKWSHWKLPGQTIVRTSLGRYGDDHTDRLDDDALLAAALADLDSHAGLKAAPTDSRITRWPRSFPQYEPHHRRRTETLRASLPAGIVVAGAAYGGIGVPACIRQGGEAARAVLDWLATR